VTRANGGILFLDELLEFQPQALDALREPLERGYVDIHRATSRVRFPARFWLVAATNLCRCGNLGNGIQACRCAPLARYQYQGRISGPLLDRFDLRLLSQPQVPTEQAVLLRDLKKQIHEFWKNSGQLVVEGLTPEAEKKLQEVSSSSVRRIKKLRIVGATLARLEGSSTIGVAHLIEAESLMQNFEEAERSATVALRYAHGELPNLLGLQEVARTPPEKKGPGKTAPGVKKRRL
jgi:predicted ATPase with chaperone activity